MACGPAHIFAGCGVGLAIACLDQGEKTESSHDPFIAGGIGAFFGKLPDLLEPATNPHHRQFCHSLLVLGAVGYGFKRAYEWKPKDQIEAILRMLALVAAGGYISHLVLDAVTPRSLPLVGRL